MACLSHIFTYHESGAFAECRSSNLQSSVVVPIKTACEEGAASDRDYRHCMVIYREDGKAHGNYYLWFRV